MRKGKKIKKLKKLNNKLLDLLIKLSLNMSKEKSKQNNLNTNSTISDNKMYTYNYVESGSQ